MIKQALLSILPDRTAFELLAKVLGGAVQYGSLTVIDPWGERHAFGTGGAPFVTLHLTDPDEPGRLLADPCLRAGEAYMDGTLIIEEGTLRDFLMIGVAAGEQLSKQSQKIKQFTPRRKLERHNQIDRSRANVAHHYDLSEEFYRLFLDADLQYSCAYFQAGDETLEEAQAKKKRHIAAKLLMKPGARVLDIGSGWGGLALELAKSHGVQVDGLTLSQEQLTVAQSRAVEDGLQDRVRFHLRDYRHEVGSYDRIVSVGMFEHVGTPHFAEFFETVNRLLAPDGVAVIHAIGHKDSPNDADPWIDKHIFPGAYCPSLSEVLAAVEQTGLWVTDVEILRVHYADTLERWYERFQVGRARAAALYDERFCRMWEFYLASCEAGFRVGGLMVFQIQLARDIRSVPLTRDYMSEAERAAPAQQPTCHAAHDRSGVNLGAPKRPLSYRPA
jgi:cyclopropane-fatty-acyl-phospholipid synthase